MVPEREADHSPSSVTEIKSAGNTCQLTLFTFVLLFQGAETSLYLCWKISRWRRFRSVYILVIPLTEGL
jgi:hypothetical protein